MSKKVSINLVVLNGEEYIRHCLDSVLKQTYPHESLELNILDNGSTDRTLEIIKEFSDAISYKLKAISYNIGMWPGQEELLKQSGGEYTIALSVDVLLDRDFIKNGVARMEQDKSIGALQAKIYQCDLKIISPYSTYVEYGEIWRSNLIDTCGFQMFRSRRLINIGQGEADCEKFEQEKEIFGVEGAVPVFRREALESIRLETQDGKIVDHDMFWYGDDLDIAWRMRLFGWKEIYAPNVVAYHDRSTTKDVSRGWFDYLRRVKKRRLIPIKKRRLQWANDRITLIKNDHAVNIIKDLPRIVWREIMVLGYTALFEPAVFLELPRFFRLIPKMLKRRREIMRRTKVSAAEIHKWMT